MLINDAIAGRLQAAMVQADLAQAPSDRPRNGAPTLLPTAVLLVALRGADIAAAAFAAGIAILLLPSFGIAANWRPQLLLGVAGGLAATAACSALGGYAVSILKRPVRRAVIQAASVATGIAAIAACAALAPSEPRLLPTWPLLWAVAFAAIQASSLPLLVIAVGRWQASGRLHQRIALVGQNNLSEGFLQQLAEQKDPWITLAGLYRDDSDDVLHSYAGHRVAGHLADLPARSRRERIDAVVLAMPLTQPDRIVAARELTRSMIADVYLLADFAPGASGEAAPNQGPVVMVKLGSRPLTAWQAVQKELLDKVLAGVLLFLLLPLLAIVALLIKLDSPGPVLFHQPRLGFNNLVYTVLKFRTMYHHQADLLADKQTTRGDPRITRVGRFLRRLSLDELPQLANVLGGSMSLVGPRPHAPSTKAGNMLFHDAVADYALRHRVKPGITGWAQVNGWRGETKTREHIEQRVQHDLYYIDNWSIWLDCKILFLTLKREIFSKAAF